MSDISTMQAAAEAALDKGFSVFALSPGTKIPRPGTHGHLDASAMPADIEKLWNENSEYNPAVSCAASGLIVLDYDDGIPPSDLPNTYTVKTSRGLHLYYWGQLPGTKLYDSSGNKIGELKSADGYVLAAGAKHPSGVFYTVVDDSPVAEAPLDIIAQLTKKPVSDSQPVSLLGDKIPHGSHDIECHRLAGKMRGLGMEEEAIYEGLVEFVEKRCQSYGADYQEMCRKHAREICKKPSGAGLKLLIGGVDPETGVQVSAPIVSQGPPADFVAANYNISIPFSEDIFYGLAGRIIKKLQPQTESHPVGNMLELLSAFGNIIGSNPYYQVEDTKHHTNLFVVKVGKTSRSRKGTGKGRIERIASQLDLNWFTSRNTSGLGSGEIVVYEVRDPVTASVRDKKTGEFKTGVIDQGESDKRLYISEGEFAGILAVAGRKDSILSKVIRDGWDSKPLRNKAKSGSVICMNPHISISADITREELLTQLQDADKFNGFGNRFLWCFVERQGSLPHGGEPLDWSEEIIKLYEAKTFSENQKRVFMTHNARRVWDRVYEELMAEVPGIAGAVTSRGTAQVLRMSLILAMLDRSDHIDVQHLEAAMALWKYCEDSAQVIFGGVMKSHQCILDFLKPGPKTLKEIREDLFKRNKKLEEITADVSTLAAIGRIYARKDEAGLERFYVV